MDRIRAILATMRVPLEHVDLGNPKHVGRLIRELGALNRDHADLDEVRGLLKQHRFVNLSSS
ncbi:MAG: hypothetical protein MI757_12935 [Pirellulales bacterium]|nr:hypothetical protein [Pirellulales bacterium]